MPLSSCSCAHESLTATADSSGLQKQQISSQQVDSKSSAVKSNQAVLWSMKIRSPHSFASYNPVVNLSYLNTCAAFLQQQSCSQRKAASKYLLLHYVRSTEMKTEEQKYCKDSSRLSEVTCSSTNNLRTVKMRNHSKSCCQRTRVLRI